MADLQDKEYLKIRDRDFIIEASAGTGKTRAILDRICFLIEDDPDLKMGQLAAITFTEKAAAELRFKLRQKLDEKKQSKRIAQAISEFDQAQVSTIHAFCARLLRMRPVEAGVSPSFKVADEEEGSLLFDRIWDSWLETMVEKDPGFFRNLRRMEIKPDDLKETTKKIHSNRDLFDACFEKLTSPKNFKSPRQGYRELAALAKEAEAAKADALGRFLKNAVFWLDSAGENQDRVWLQLTMDSRLKTYDYKKDQGKISGIRDRALKLMDEVRYQPLADILKPLKGFLEMVSEEKQRLEILDFQDLLLKARDMAKKPEVREYLKRRFKYILVDEFQDTDPLQVELVFFLAEKEERSAKTWQEVELKPGKLFLVGDPKQSIYRFRRADLQIYHEAHKIMLSKKTGSRCKLDRNYRSHRGLLEWVNLAFHDIFREEDGFQPAYQPLVPGDNPPEAKAPLSKPVIVLQLEKGDFEKPELVDNVRRVEANAVCDFIQWAHSHKIQIAHKTGDKIVYRDARYKDFAVLYPKNDDIRFIKEELRTRGIPFQIAAGQEFLQRDEIAGLRAVLLTMVNPVNHVALLGALRSMFFGVTDCELFEYRKDRQTWNWLDCEPDPQKYPAIASAYQFLKALYKVREHKPITRLIEELMARAKIRHLKNLHPQFNQALLNLERIKAFARSFEEQGTGLFDFIAWLDNMDVSGDNGWPEMFALESDDAVNLMTFHKSKGLEFPVAILANLSSSLPQGADDLIKNWKRQELALSIGKFQTANYSSLEQEESRHTDSQNIRTLYVAATRAKQYLVIPDHRSLGYDKGGLFIDQLIAGLPNPEGANNPAPEIIAVEKMSKFAAPQKPIEYGLEKFAEAAPADTEIEKSREQFGKILSGKIALAREFMELSAPSREEEFEEFQGGDSIAREDALEIGGIVHKVIELAGKQDEKFAMALAGRIAEERGAVKLLPQIQALVKEFWKSEIKKKIDAGESWQELPFLAEVQGKLYRGQIDLILRDQHGLSIVDFKTDNISRDQVDQRAEKYRGQMKIYSEVASRLKKQKVFETSILFLKPDVKKEL